MPVNKRLKEVLTTEMSTARCANWLLDMVARAAQSADGTLEGRKLSKVATKLSIAIGNYNSHRTHNDPHRTQSFTSLHVTAYESVANVVSCLNCDNEVKIIVPTDIELAAAIQGRIDQTDWFSDCHGCGRRRRGLDKIDNNLLCSSCKTNLCLNCTKCKKLVLKQSMIILTRGQSVCKDCIPADMFICMRCGKGQAGSPGHGKGLTVEEMVAEGIKVCIHCAPLYHRVQCGHICTEPYRLIENVSREDDDRFREIVQGTEERGKTACYACYANFEQEVRPQHWDAHENIQLGEYDQVGSPRSFGVEIEVCQARKQPAMPDDMKQYWNAKDDQSLPKFGVEMASVILRGNKGLEVLRAFCHYARDNKWAVDARCGMHTHFGLLDENDQQREAVAMGYLMTYEMWCQFVPGSRWRNNKYCRRPNMTASQAYAKAGMIIPHLIGSNDHNARRVWVNWYALRKFGTVEIRLHHGTILYEKIANWIKAHLQFIDWCVSMGGPKEVFKALKTYQGRHPRKIFLAITAKAWWKNRDLPKWLRSRAATLHGDRSLLIPKRKGGGDVKKLQPELTIKGVVPAYHNGGRSWFITNGITDGANPDSRYLNMYAAWEGPPFANAYRTATLEVAEGFAAQYADRQPNQPAEAPAPTMEVAEEAIADRILAGPPQPRVRTFTFRPRQVGQPVAVVGEPV